ncbi:hypothetical protein HC928_08060 [bacterium]|nr:hypothetical protein [bacterium]
MEEVIDGLGNLVSRVSDTTVQDIRNVISDQVFNGKTIDETVAALMKLSEITSVHRAKMIAVNESNRAYSSASVLAYKKAVWSRQNSGDLRSMTEHLRFVEN